MTTNYYLKNQEKLQNEACEKYQNLSKEEKNEKCQYVCEWYRNLSKEEKENKHQYGSEWYKNLPEND